MPEDRSLISLVPLDGEEILPAWQVGNPKFAADARTWWDEAGALPEGIEGEDRVNEMLAIAYVEGEFAGVTTAVISPYEPLRCNFAVLRIAVVPEFRRHYLQIRLAVRSREMMEAYSLQHPDEGISGMITVRQAPFQATRISPPVGVETRSTFITYNEKGHQLRVRWFSHIRV